MIPKMHFLTHFPDQLKEFAGLRNHATQRMEAKNGAIKKPPIQNYRNVCKTIAYQQEFWYVSKRLDSNWKRASNFLTSGMEMKHSRALDSDKEFCEKYLFEVNNINNLYECEQVKCFGFLYKIGDFIIIKDNIDSRENVIGKIANILVASGTPAFKIELYDIKEFIKKTNCYQLQSNGLKDVRYLKSIVHKHPVFSIESGNGDTIVQIRYFFHILK